MILLGWMTSIMHNRNFTAHFIYKYRPILINESMTWIPHFIYADHSLTTHLHANSIRDIPPSGLARSDNLYHLPPLHSIVSRHRIIGLYARELSITKAVPLEKLLLLILG